MQISNLYRTVFFMQKRNRLRRWEAAALMAFAVTLAAGSWAGASESALAGQVLRLHVVANSDSAEDQALKLQVRDAVLAEAAPLLEGVHTREEAELAVAARLEKLAAAGRAVLDAAGCGDSITVSLEDTWFPTKTYDGFALPAGEYRALRVVIGAGEGHNWWCVVFPPLCMASVTEEVETTAAMAGLNDGQVALITGRDGGYVLRFKVIEWWEQLMTKLSG